MNKSVEINHIQPKLCSYVVVLNVVTLSVVNKKYNVTIAKIMATVRDRI